MNTAAAPCACLLEPPRRPDQEPRGTPAPGLADDIYNLVLLSVFMELVMPLEWQSLMSPERPRTTSSMWCPRIRMDTHYHQVGHQSSPRARKGRSPSPPPKKGLPSRKLSPAPESVVLHVDHLSRNVNEAHLKEIFEEGYEDIRGEIEMLLQCSHPNVLRYFGLDSYGILWWWNRC